MDFFSASWLVTFFAFAAGIGIGVVIYKSMHSDDARARKLEEELDQVKHDYELYKQGVTQHFSKTSELVNDLTKDYVKVYKHLAESADKFADIQTTPELTQQQSSTLVSFINEVEEAAESDDTPPVEPPKDYAPKEEQSEGTLSESFSVGSKNG